MFNAESFKSSDAELSGENLNDSAINQQRGDMVNQAMSEQGERNINEMSLTDLMNIDIKSLSDNELSTYITRLTNESNKLSQQEQAPTQVVEQAPQISENKIAPEVAKATAERVKNDPKANGFLNKKAMAAILAVSITAGGIAGYFGANIQQSSAEPGNDQIRTEQSAEEAFESLTGYDKLDKLIDGSFDQDSNLGCYESEGKVSQNSVGNPNLILEELGIDPATATPEQRGVVSEYMSYSMKYPAAFDAIAYGAPGFDNLTINEAEDKISSMSDEEKAEIQKFLKKQYENC